MSQLPGAKQSPRIENGIIKFYEGDTFSLNVEIELVDQDKLPVNIGADDTVEVVFLDKSENVVTEMTFSGVSNNTISVEFTRNTLCFRRKTRTYRQH